MLRLLELTPGLPAFPLLIQNLAMMNGHCEQTNHRYSIFRPVANLHSSIRTIIGSAPSGRCHPVMSRVNSIYWSRPTTTFSICIPNPYRSGPLRPEPVRSKPTGTSPSGSCSANIRFSCTEPGLRPFPSGCVAIYE